ncbi:hypothetical protein QAD02_018451 [Eretmocerus hayati]|uniref:Uncharacterized protein n=1 Tax=Eretmocerus hayati TaxID=131215 RepID=A0ACC2PGE6_9HYME|nr:hypothetical protein QAD02_018451 [Eretmocerus hayati]
MIFLIPGEQPCCERIIGKYRSWINLAMHGNFGLNKTSLSLIENGECLEDNHIDYFNTLVIESFPLYSPIQTWQTQLHSIRPIARDRCHVQILYSPPPPRSEIGHWICTFYDGKNLHIYDSINSKKLHPDFERVLRVLHPYCFENFENIRFPTVQWQRNERDCGVLAIAVAVSLLNRVDPSGLVFLYDELRPHLIKIFLTNKIIPFPLELIKCGMRNNTHVLEYHTGGVRGRLATGSEHGLKKYPGCDDDLHDARNMAVKERRYPILEGDVIPVRKKRECDEMDTDGEHEVNQNYRKFGPRYRAPRVSATNVRKKNDTELSILYKERTNHVVDSCSSLGLKTVESGTMFPMPLVDQGSLQSVVSRLAGDTQKLGVRSKQHEYYHRNRGKINQRRKIKYRGAKAELKSVHESVERVGQRTNTDPSRDNRAKKNRDAEKIAGARNVKEKYKSWFRNTTAVLLRKKNKFMSTLADQIDDSDVIEKKFKAERIVTSCIYVRNRCRRSCRKIFEKFRKAIESLLIIYDDSNTKELTLSDRIDILYGVNGHKDTSELYHYEATYQFRNTLPGIISIDHEGKATNVLPLEDTKSGKRWKCGKQCKRFDKDFLNTTVKFLRKFKDCLLPGLSSFSGEMDICDVMGRRELQGHPLVCYSDPFVCNSHFLRLRILSAHYPRIRIFLTQIYEMHRLVRYVEKIGCALDAADLNTLTDILKNEMENKRFPITTNNGVCLDENIIYERYSKAFKAYNKIMQDSPTELCVSCECYCKVSKLRPFESVKKFIDEGFVNALSERYDNISKSLICYACLGKFKTRKLPPKCYLNERLNLSCPTEISQLNFFEQILIKRANAFRTLQKKSTVMKGNVPHYCKIDSVCGRTFHLPIPLEKTWKKICPGEKILIDNPEYYILMRGVPSKKDKIWEDVVDVKRLHNALIWCKQNNLFYSNINLTDAESQISLHLKNLELVHHHEPDENEAGNSEKNANEANDEGTQMGPIMGNLENIESELRGIVKKEFIIGKAIVKVPADYNTLLLSIINDDMETMDMILASRANPNRGLCRSMVDDGYPLHLSLALDKPACIRKLLEAGARMSFIYNRISNVYSAIYFKRTSCIEQLLLFGLDPNFDNATARQPHSLIHYGIIAGEIEIVEKLLEHGADPNNLDKHGCNGLLCALQLGRTDFAKKLIDHKAMPDNMNLVTQNYPLQLCVKHRDVELVEKLISANANFDYGRGTIHGSALQMAIKIGDERIVALLLRNKVDVNSYDYHNYYPIDTCFTSLENWLIPAAARVNILHMVIEYGSDVSKALTYPYIPNKFFRIGTTRTYKLLKSKNMRVSKTGGDDYICLWMAMQNSDTSLLRGVVETDGISINTRNHRKNTVLHAAAGNLQLTMIKLIMRLGANPNKRNNNGFTPLDLLLVKKYHISDSFQWLLDKCSASTILGTLNFAYQRTYKDHAKFIIRYIVLACENNDFGDIIFFREKCNPKLVRYFDRCTNESEKLRENVVPGSSTYLDLTTLKRRDKIILDSNFVRAVHKEKVNTTFKIYGTRISIMMNKAKKYNKLIARAKIVLAKLMRLEPETYHMVLIKILHDLKIRDLNTLVELK